MVFDMYWLTLLFMLLFFHGFLLQLPADYFTLLLILPRTFVKKITNYFIGCFRYLCFSV
jgi:hypothetical protein